jgi:hypothetical protein
MPPDLLAELAAALARLDWRDQQLWMAAAATATATLQAQALRQQQQEQQQHQHLSQQQVAAPGAAFSAGQQQRQPQLQHQQAAPSLAPGLVSSSAVADSEEDEDGSYLLEDFEADLLLLGSSFEADTWEREAAAAAAVAAAAGDGDAGFGADADEPAYVRQQQWQQQGEDEDEEGEWPGPPVFDDDEAAGRQTSEAAAAAYGQEAALALPPAQPQWQHQQQQHTQQHQQQQPTWLAADFPKLAGALAAVGHADSGLMQLLGSQAVPLLPLMPLAELAQLADAFASLGLPHPELVPALAQQLFAAASRAGSSRGFANGGHGHAADTAALVRAMAALQQLGWAADAADAHGMQQQQRLLQLLQARVVQLGGATSSPQSSSSRRLSVSDAPAAPGQAVSVLQLLLAAACWDAAWRHSPLLLWACGAIAGAGLDALSPPQLQAAALALAELQSPSTADAQQASKQQQAQAAAAGAMQMVAAAAAARAHECSAGVLASALWGAATLGVVADLLADVAAEAVLTTRVQGQQAGQLSAGQHAQLVWALQQMGRQDLAQAVLLRASLV